MKFLLTILTVVCSISSVTFACGPSPQKVTKEVIIQATPDKVWAIVGDFSTMQKWHPSVLASTLEKKKDAEGVVVNYRTLTLLNGGIIVEKQREMQNETMKIGVVVMQSDMAVSNYSDAISVKPGLRNGEAVVTWVGRFNNKANAMQAPEGQDNATAITAIEAWYDLGLANLKKVVEEQ